MYVFADLVWDASLIFSQIVLDFNDDPLGHEAKFRNARISYYTGDFAWAQTQLDALKASTSKLISNDAIDLSLLITDNFNLDTIFEPMEIYARADLLIMQRRFGLARQTLDTLTTDYPGHSLEDEILIVLGDLALQEGNIEDAIGFYEEVVDLHFDDITGDDALYNLAKIYDEQLKDFEKAEEMLKIVEDKKYNESINEGKYHDYRNDESMTPKQKIGRSMREIRDSLNNLDKLVKMNVRLKNELNVNSQSYWKNTHKALNKISERLVKLANKVGQLQ